MRRVILCFLSKSCQWYLKNHLIQPLCCLPSELIGQRKVSRLVEECSDSPRLWALKRRSSTSLGFISSVSPWWLQLYQAKLVVIKSHIQRRKNMKRSESSIMFSCYGVVEVTIPVWYQPRQHFRALQWNHRTVLSSQFFWFVFKHWFFNFFIMVD